MALVELLGIQRLRFRARMDQRLVDPPLLAQLFDRQVDGVADHLQAQPGEMLKLLGHRTGGGIRGIQRAVVEITGMGHPFRQRRRQLGDQYRRLGPLGQQA